MAYYTYSRQTVKSQHKKNFPNLLKDRIFFSDNMATAICLCFSALSLFAFCFLFSLIRWGGLIVFCFFAFMVGSLYYLILRLPLPSSVGALFCLFCGSSSVNPLQLHTTFLAFYSTLLVHRATSYAMRDQLQVYQSQFSAREDLSAADTLRSQLKYFLSHKCVIWDGWG